MVMSVVQVMSVQTPTLVVNGWSAGNTPPHTGATSSITWPSESASAFVSFFADKKQCGFPQLLQQTIYQTAADVMGNLSSSVSALALGCSLLLLLLGVVQ